MSYIYIDESGDLGRSKGSSRFFIISAIKVDTKRTLEIIAKKIWKNIKNKKRGELHATHELESTRRRMFRLLNKNKKMKIYSIILKKGIKEIDKKTYGDMMNKLINFILGSSNINYSEKLYITIDKRDINKKDRESLINFLMSTINDPSLSIYVENSHSSRSLQVVDFVAWAYFQKYENNDISYCNVLSDIENSEIFF